VQERLRLAAAEGKAIFLSTRLLDMAERLCDRVGIIDRATSPRSGRCRELKEKIAPGSCSATSATAPMDDYREVSSVRG
jgi:ABC-2 type transport system ATP-binding protein